MVNSSSGREFLQLITFLRNGFGFVGFVSEVTFSIDEDSEFTFVFCFLRHHKLMTQSQHAQMGSDERGAGESKDSSANCSIRSLRLVPEGDE